MNNSSYYPGLGKDESGTAIRNYLLKTYDFDPMRMADYHSRYFHPAITNGTELNICWTGDSMMRGQDVNQQTQSPSNICLAGLRTKYGRTDAAEGFIPNFYSGLTQTRRGVKTGSPGNESANASVPGWCLYRMDGANGVTTFTVTFTFTGATDVSVVWDARNDVTRLAAWALNNSGGSGTFQFSTTGTDFTASIVKLATGLNPATTYTLTISADAAASGQLWLGGIVTEATNGFHIHNTAISGKQLFDTGSNNGIYRGDLSSTAEAIQKRCHIDLNLSSGVVSGFQRCGLYISNFGINDQGQYGIVGVDNYGALGTAAVATTVRGYEVYKYYLSRYLGEIKSNTAHATPIMVAFPTATARDSGIRTFWGAMKEMCDVYDTPFINLAKAFQWGDRTTLIPGYDDGGGIHFTAAGYAAIGNAIKDCITKSYDYWLLTR